MRSHVLGRLHVLTDCQLQQRYTAIELAEMATKGGADVVQYRDKRALTTQQLLNNALAMQKICNQLIVNDRVDIAFASQCGVHLGPNDLPIPFARNILPHQMIGATANDLQTAITLCDLPIDYLGVGPVFFTTSKQQPKPALGLKMLQEIVRAVNKPVIAIGGITRDNIRSVMQTGVHGVAVLAEIVCAQNPVQATQILKDRMNDV